MTTVNGNVEVESGSTSPENKSNTTSTSKSDNFSKEEDLKEKIIINLSNHHEEYQIPIVGYEIMEARARFTVFKINVRCQRTGQSWPVFRRYTDFVRLEKKLRKLFPTFGVTLPPKRWFGDNFDPSFLEQRSMKLQAFVNSLKNNKDIWQSAPVTSFFCFGDSHEDVSISNYDISEEMTEKLQYLLKEKENEVKCLQSENELLRNQVAALMESLRLECSLNTVSNPKEAKVSDIHEFNVAFLDVIHDSLQKPKTSPSEENIAAGIEETLSTSEAVELAEEASISEEN